MSGYAQAMFTCPCGKSVTVPLRLGAGNDFVCDPDPEDWYIAFDDLPIVRCPQHRDLP